MDKISKLKIVLSCVMFLEAKLIILLIVSQHSLCKRQPLPPYLQAAITNFTRIIIPSIPTLLILQAGLHINNRGGFQQCYSSHLLYKICQCIHCLPLTEDNHSSLSLLTFRQPPHNDCSTLIKIWCLCNYILLFTTNIIDCNQLRKLQHLPRTSTTWCLLSKIKPAVLKYWVSIS